MRTPRPMRLCVRGSGDDMMSSAARCSLKSLAFSAIINCSAQEYDTPSTTNDEGDHCEKLDGGCQNNTTLSVEYSREGSNADGANPSEAVLRIWAFNVPGREHHASAVRDYNVPVREHQASIVRACNVPVREHQASAGRACNVPVRNTRPPNHNASPDPRFLAPCPRRSLAKKPLKLLLTAPEGAGGSKLLLLDERCDSSVDLRE